MASPVGQQKGRNFYCCSSWLPAVIHLATSCKNYQTVQALSERFSVKPEMVLFHLQNIEKFNYLECENGKWKFVGDSLHFPKESAFDQTFQVNRRVHALLAIAKKENENLPHSVLVSLDVNAVMKIKKIIIESIEQIPKSAAPAPCEDVYGLNFDFFKA